AGRGVLAQYPDGIWLVELAPLADPQLLAPTVSAVLGIRDRPGLTPAERLVAAVQGRRILLILAKCERVVQGGAELVFADLTACSGVAIMAASREALGVPVESQWLLEPLSVPREHVRLTADEVLASEAGRLFVERARSALATFVLTERNAA